MRHCFALLIVFTLGCSPKTLAPQRREDPAAAWKTLLNEDPWRLDARFQLQQAYQEQGDFEAQYALWADTLKRTDNDWRFWKWEEGRKLPKRSSQLIPPKLQGVVEFYLGKKEAEADDQALRLAKLSVTFYPAHPEFERDRALCYSRRGDHPHALQCLLKLLEKHPQDRKTLKAIGDVLEQAGKQKEARIYYEKAEERAERP